MEKDGRIVIYPTACDGMRECDGADLDNRSSWSRFYLLLDIMDWHLSDLFMRMQLSLEQPPPIHVSSSVPSGVAVHNHLSSC